MAHHYQKVVFHTTVVTGCSFFVSWPPTPAPQLEGLVVFGLHMPSLPWPRHFRLFTVLLVAQLVRTCHGDGVGLTDVVGEDVVDARPCYRMFVIARFSSKP